MPKIELYYGETEADEDMLCGWLEVPVEFTPPEYVDSLSGEKREWELTLLRGRHKRRLLMAIDASDEDIVRLREYDKMVDEAKREKHEALAAIGSRPRETRVIRSGVSV